MVGFGPVAPSGEMGEDPHPQLQSSARAAVSLGGRVWEIGFLHKACPANPSERQGHKSAMKLPGAVIDVAWWMFLSRVAFRPFGGKTGTLYERLKSVSVLRELERNLT